MNIGKKILSAFVEVGEETKKSTESRPSPPQARDSVPPPVQDTGKFRQYFDQLFTDANIQGPDYFEFSRMVEAMKALPDEKARYAAAFAGLSVQGLDKERLLSTAAEYVQLLERDASSFHSTIDSALQERVHAKQKEMEEKKKRIGQLSQEITDLNAGMEALQKEILENEEKIQASTGGYTTELEQRKSRILSDIEKIKQNIQ